MSAFKWLQSLSGILTDFLRKMFMPVESSLCHEEVYHLKSFFEGKHFSIYVAVDNLIVLALFLWWYTQSQRFVFPLSSALLLPAIGHKKNTGCR